MIKLIQFIQAAAAAEARYRAELPGPNVGPLGDRSESASREAREELNRVIAGGDVEVWSRWAEAVDATERARAALRRRTENDDEAHRLIDAAVDCDAAEDRAYDALRLALAQAYRSRP